MRSASMIAVPMPVLLRSARVVYPNGDSFEGTFNSSKQKHGCGVYSWAAVPGVHPWNPLEGNVGKYKMKVAYFSCSVYLPYADGERY